ncbi:MAG: glycosyltransferase family 39 protein [Phormidesmis sp.]
MNRPNLSAASSAEPAQSESLTKSLGALDIFLLLCAALGVLLRSLWVGKRELWYDEVLSVLLSSGQKNAYKLPEVPFNVRNISSLLDLPAEKGLGGSVETVKTLIKGTLGDPHPPLFYLSEHGWMRLFGNSEAALRSLVLLSSLVTLLVAYSLGRRVLGQRGGLIFTALLSLNPFFFSHSLNLRMYSAMVLWVVVSGGCLLALVGTEKVEISADNSRATGWGTIDWRRWALRGGIIVALTAGLLTQYLFAYWFFAIAALMLCLDRKHWLQHGLTLAASILLFMPWALWGTRQQAQNRGDVLNQISSVGGPLRSALQHGKDLAQTLANHLLLGHLTTSMTPVGDPIKPAAVAAGCAVIGFLAVCVVGLYRRRQYRALMIGCLMGLLPLAVAIAIDIITHKYTVGFGWGRSTIVALPGCLLLVAAWLELGTGRWRTTLTAGLLVIYLAVVVGDFVGRDRQMFHTVNSELLKTDEPTLVVMNSRAWGHVLRLVYYLDETANAEVLATSPAALPEALKTALVAKNYDRLLWLKSEYPLWNLPETETEARALTTETEALLQAEHPLAGSQKLRGTMNLDRFELQVYQ